MSKRQRSARCRNKVCYPNEDAAGKAAVAIGRRYRKRVRAYRCTVCGHWHVGSSRWAHIAHVQRLIDSLRTEAPHASR